MDATVIITYNSFYNYEWIVENSRLTVATQNATKNIKIDKNKIIKS